MEAMRDVLRRELGRSLRTMPELDRLRAAWPVACGRAMASRGEIVTLEDGTLTVAVDDPVWLDEMRSRGAVLQSELARIANVPLSGIHFEGNVRRAAANTTPEPAVQAARHTRPARAKPPAGKPGGKVR